MGVRSRCTLIRRRHAEWTETKSRDLFASCRCQVGKFSRPGATSSLVIFFPAVVISVKFGQSLVSFVSCQAQPNSTLLSTGRCQTGSFSRRCFKNGLLGTTND